MVEDIFVDKIKKIYNEVLTEKGSLYFFMIIKMDDFFDKWSVAVSAPWTSAENRNQVFSYLLKKLQRDLTKEEGSTIARIGIFTPTDHFINLFTSRIKVNSGGEPLRLRDTKVNGYKVHDAWVFHAVSPEYVSPSPSDEE